MLDQDRKIYIDMMQRNLTRTCYVKCKQSKSNASKNNTFSQQCLQNCYQKYISAIGTVNKTIKQLGYNRHSIISYKAYPQTSMETLFYYDKQLFVNMDIFPFAVRFDVAA